LGFLKSLGLRFLPSPKKGQVELNFDLNHKKTPGKAMKGLKTSWKL
jgi:hypothetical protein